MRKQKTSQNSSLALYRKVALPPPGINIEKELVRKAKSGDMAAKDTLVRHYFGFVYQNARPYALKNPGVNIEDLIQEGMLGVSKAIDMFEPERGHRLITYAGWWIRAYITRFSQKNRSDICFPREAKAAGLIQVSASTTVYDGGTIQILDLVPSEDNPIDEWYADKETAANVRKLVSTSCKRYKKVGRDIINKRLMTDNPMTLEEVGDLNDLSRERIRQVEVEVKKTLRKRLKDYMS